MIKEILDLIEFTLEHLWNTICEVVNATCNVMYYTSDLITNAFFRICHWFLVPFMFPSEYKYLNQLVLLFNVFAIPISILLAICFHDNCFLFSLLLGISLKSSINVSYLTGGWY